MIEIYGIPEEVWRCPGCKTAVDLLKALKINYKFINVINNKDDHIEYDRPVIVDLAKRIGCFPSLSIRYPVIFVDNIKQHNIPSFKQTLISLGYDKDIIED